MKLSICIATTAVIALAVITAAPALAITPADAIISGTGVKVLLYPDGRWEYLMTIDQAAPLHIKPANAIKAFKSMTGLYEVWSDPQKWTTDKAKSGDEELVLRHSNGSAKAVARGQRSITKSMSVEAWVLEWARRSAPAAELVTQEKSTVNGVEILRLNAAGDGTVFYGFCWPGKAGYVQLMTMTGAGDFDGLKTELDELLKGLVINKP
ncbi:MAG: hypothetical protein AABY51_06050 [Deltaproteobacteria bacterium]